MDNHSLFKRLTIIAAWSVTVAAGAAVGGCGDAGSQGDPRRAQTDEAVRGKYGKSLSGLPEVKLVLISPHNENICNEYAWAFSRYYARKYGRRVWFEWRDVGGGGSTITRYLANVYKHSKSKSCGIDIFWGGGQFNFIPLAKAGILQPLNLPADVLENIPPKLGGVRLYDKQMRWVGSAVSAFGFLYNRRMLRKCRIEPPRRWDDLGRRRFADLISMADPAQSGSAAATYQMIARSGRNWPDGWSKLLRILANARRFTDSAGSAANGPALGESLVATCIDFYGALRVAEAPQTLVYVSPPGETTFGPDPIAILANCPHPQIAKRFVEFVMSRRGQALWALPVDAADGPVRSPLARQPIRKDVYDAYRGRMLSSIVNPYQAGQSMQMEGFRKRIDYGVLRQLVRAAAIDNAADLRAARNALIASDYAPELLERFNRLPDNVADLDAMARVRRDMKDQARRERIITDWQRFFRDKFRSIARGRR